MAGGSDGSDDPTLNLFGDVMKGLTPAKFVRACVEENDRYMRAFDPRLLRPRVIPSLGRGALFALETIEKLRPSSVGRGEATAQR